MIHKDSLYKDGVCRLCDQHLDDEGHDPDCLGNITDRLTYEIKIDGPNCGRGCCGYTHTSVEGDDLDELYQRAVAEASDCVYPSYSVRAVAELPYEESAFQAARRRWDTERKAAEAAEAERQRKEAQQRAKKSAAAALEAERADLTPEAYARRLALVEAMP